MAGSGVAHLRSATDDVLLRAEHVIVRHPVGRREYVHAVSDVSLDVLRGETVGLVGESGCGKSSLGRALLMFPAPQSGTVTFDGRNLAELNEVQLREARAVLQVVVQDPISSLNPRRTVRKLVAEGLTLRGEKVDDEVIDELLVAVGLDPAVHASRRPGQLSGGQCQRVAIARALLLNPQMIICDEAVSALDVSVQAQILNLLRETRDRLGLSMLFIAHNLAVVKNISDRIAVMYLGKICEVAASDELYSHPAHPYTVLLLDAIPKFDSEDLKLESQTLVEPPSSINPPTGCRFRTRCPRADAVCAEREPEVEEISPGHFVACHFPVWSRDGAAVPIAMSQSGSRG